MIDIDNYHKTFPDYPKCLIQDRGVTSGFWWVGNYYKRKNGFHGEYPPSYLKRIKALFPNKKPILHLFGGTVECGEDEYSIDINSDLNPYIVGDAERVGEYFDSGIFELIIADPPYTEKDAAIYGYPMPNKKMVIRNARAVCKAGGYLVWLDTALPIFRKAEWNLKGTIGLDYGWTEEARIGLFCGTNRKFRVISIFKATSKEVYERGLEDENISS